MYKFYMFNSTHCQLVWIGILYSCCIKGIFLFNPCLQFFFKVMIMKFTWMVRMVVSETGITTEGEDPDILTEVVEEVAVEASVLLGLGSRSATMFDRITTPIVIIITIIVLSILTIHPNTLRLVFIFLK